MTLVIAGHSSGGFEEGIYFASDSHITQSNNVLVKGFKKVIEIPVRVMGLNFCGEWFNGYLGNRYEGACSVYYSRGLPQQTSLRFHGNSVYKPSNNEAPA